MRGGGTGNAEIIDGRDGANDSLAVDSVQSLGVVGGVLAGDGVRCSGVTGVVIVCCTPLMVTVVVIVGTALSFSPTEEVLVAVSSSFEVFRLLAIVGFALPDTLGLDMFLPRPTPPAPCTRLAGKGSVATGGLLVVSRGRFFHWPL
jgi:hypothetical protein